RKHLPFYIRGIKNAAQLRKKLMISTELQEVRDALVQASKNL
ncbi:tRNA dihydrouridine synthase DusB, partial [Candidatus Dependentiae bacterium]|nr:tRNA dihydrouridine synthase DusB [Candidatus Dependentiae bacterium]